MLTLYYHPLSSFCWKALIALYEADVDFQPRLVNLGDAADRAAFAAVWPLAKFPVLRDDGRGQTVAESTIIIEYLAGRFASAASLIPADPEAARETRLRDRLFDNYIHAPMQKVVVDRLRPGDQKDPQGVADALSLMRTADDLMEPMIGAGRWALGEAFTLADCAAFPALYYGDYALGLTDWPNLSDYLERLKARPSVARVLQEAAPFLQYFPLRNDK